MSILKLNHFKVSYPLLWTVINSVRIETGSNSLDLEYSNNSNVPIQSSDASLAESFLSKDNNINLTDFVPLGLKQLEKIKEVVRNESDMNKWVSILYSNSEIESINKPKNKHKVKTIFNKNTEIILLPKLEIINNKQIYKAFRLNTDEEFTDKIDIGKIKYALKNKGIIRGREDKFGVYSWRVIKRRIIKE